MRPTQELWETALLIAPSLRTAAAIGFAASLVGTFVILRRESLAALALPQAVAVGAAVGFRLGTMEIPAALVPLLAHLGWPTLPPALLVTAVTVMLLVWMRHQAARQWLLPAIYIGGLSLSILVVANAGQHLSDLQNLFTGYDVAVSAATERITIPPLLLVGLVCGLLWRRWLLIAQAPQAAQLSGLRPERWDGFFLCLLAAVLLLGTNASSAPMVLTMLFLPAATALPWARRIPPALVASVVVAQAFLVVGFVVSVELEWPLSHSIAGVGFVAMACSNIAARLRGR